MIKIRKRSKLLFIACLSLVLVLGWTIQSFPQAAQAMESDIRVALFVNTGTGYQGTVPYVTLQGNSALQLQGASGMFQNINKEQRIRFALDQYYLIVRETGALAEARQISEQLTAQGFQNTILTLSKYSKPVYQVLTGSEASWSAISSVQTNLKQKTQYDSTVVGSFYVQGGAFNSALEAEAQVAEIQEKGYPAFVSQVLTPAGVSFNVWIGQEGTDEARSRLQRSLEADFPHISFSEASAAEYLMMQKSVDSAGNHQAFYLSSPLSKLTLSPVATGQLALMKVEERFNRQYRGKIELSRYQNHFTVVNILPLEEYLYSVVGTEMATGWPAEALKMQAVMSRNYAYMNMQQNKYGIAHLSDTVFEQAYHGYTQEASDIRQAVDATKGQFLTYKGQVFQTLYYSNAGGQTAVGSEVWGTNLEHHQSVTSKDQYPETVQLVWYRVQDQQGKIGYVSSEYITKTNQKTKQGLEIGTVKTVSGGLNFRSGPSTAHEQIGTLNSGAKVTILEQVKQNNAYSWITGPYSGAELKEWINSRSTQTKPIASNVQTLRVTKYGPSGRVMQMEANGQLIEVSSPDAHRSIFKDGPNNARSTKFEVEEMGSYSILGANGKKVQVNQSSGQLYAVSGTQTTATAVNGNNEQFVVQNKSGDLRVVSKEPQFRLHGKGYGHGLGASQYGARAMALEGYDYKEILQHYFHKDSVIEKKY